MRPHEDRRKRRKVRRLAAAGIAAAATIAATVTALAAPGAGPAPTPPSSPQVLAAKNADTLVASRPAFLHASANDQFVRRSIASSQGTQYVPYDRTYAGIPVVGGDFVLVTDSAGRIVFHSVAQERPIGTLSTSPTLTSSKAAAVASAQLKSVSKVEDTRLVVYALGTAPATLAWESTVDGVGTDGVSRLSVDVDAHTGAVLHTQEHVMHGSGTGAWNGPNPLTIDTTSSGGTFSMSSPNITNMPCQDAATNTTFTKSTDTWGNGNATSRETGCVDAMYGAQGEFRMLSQWLGRNGMDGSGGAWPIRVGLADVNAFYDGTQVQVGHNNSNQWIGATDVIAHEMGHGIDDHTPGGISGNGTQEFIADVYGASTETFLNEPAPYDVPDFTVGEQVNLVGNGPIRNMYNPSLINGDPNCYSSSIPSAEVHAAAGPGNHWFYLLAEGTNPTNGQPTSPTCNSSTVTGLGVQNALKIVYNAQLMKTSSSSYLKYRTWTLQAAKNLDATCAQFNTVKAAWDAVSVPAQSGDPTCTVVGNDFSIAASPNSGAVNPGSSLTTTVSTTLTNGSAQTITLSASGLPAGATASFSPASVSSGGSSTMTITTATSTSPGTSTVTITGTGTSATHTAAFSLTVNGTTGPGITNGGFEAGNLSGWTVTGTTGTTTSGPHSGTYAAQIGGTSATNGDSSAAQTFTVPAGSTTLSFWYNVTCPDTITYDWATATLKDNTSNTTTTVLAKTCVANSGWTQVSAAVVAGHSYTLTLTSHDDNYAGDPTYTKYDDVALSSSTPPTNPIVNGDFETGSLSGWTTAGTASVTTSGPHSGADAAQVGGTSPTNGDSSVAQTFTAASGGTLSFWYNVTCPDTVTYDWATATLKDNTSNTTTTVLAKTCVASSGWTKVSSALTSGHSYTLTLTSHDDNYAGDPTYTKYDDVTVS